MKDRQCSDKANAGIKPDGSPMSVNRHTCASLGSSVQAPPKGTSNGGK